MNAFINGKKTMYMMLSVFLLIAFTVGMKYATEAVPVGEMPAVIQEYWAYLTAFFASAAGVILVAASRNILGYLRNWFRSQYLEEYQIHRLLETIMLYLAIITTFLTLIPDPYDKIASAIVIAVDFAISEIKNLKMSLPPGVT